MKLTKSTANDPAAAGIQRQTGMATYPLTLNQERAVLASDVTRMHGMRPPVQVVPAVMSFTGRLNVAALRRALNAILFRHTVLRCNIFQSPDVPEPIRQSRVRAFARTRVFVPGVYCQAVVTPTPLALPVYDLTEFSDEESAFFVQKSFERDCGFGFDAPPRLRASLHVLSPAKSLLVLVADHLVCDAWSMKVIKRDLLRFYNSQAEGLTPAVEQTAISYLDYAVWERANLETDFFDEDVAYWRQQWTEYGSARLSPSDLPFAIPPQPAATNFAFARLPLSHERNADVQRFARAYRCTIHTAFLAAYCILLHQYTGNIKLPLWSHFVNRLRPETADVVGWFNSTHLIGVNIAPSTTIGRLLSDIREQLTQGMRHQQMPGPLLWHRLQCAPRKPDIVPLVDTYRQDASVVLSDDVSVDFGASSEPAGGRLSQFGVYIEHDGARFTISAQTALTVFSPDSASCAVHDLAAAVEQLVSLSPEQAVAEFRPPRRAASQRRSNVDRDEMDEYIVRGCKGLFQLG